MTYMSDTSQVSGTGQFSLFDLWPFSTQDKYRFIKQIAVADYVKISYTREEPFSRATLA